MDHVVVDVEIQKTIEETPGGWEATDKLGVAVAVVYEFLTDRYLIFGPQDVSALRERLTKADRVSGYNIWKFDFPVIWGLPGRERVTHMASKCDDLLRRAWEGLKLNPDLFSAAHKGWGLDPVSKATLNARGKIANGAIAPQWFQEGKIGALHTYCLDDVALERDLTVFVDKYGYLTNGQRQVTLAPWNGVRL